MAGPQVTITLGRSGQKVVKRPLDNFEFDGSGSRSDAPSFSGGKRSVVDIDAEHSFSYTRKRLQVDMSARSSGYSGSGALNVGENDLRLKLLRKRMSKRIELEIEDQRKRELQETLQSSERPKRFLLRNNAPARRAGESLRMESVRTSSISSTIDQFGLKSPKILPQISGVVPSPRPLGPVLQPRLSIPALTSRSGPYDHSHSKGPVPITVMTASTRTVLDPCKHLKESLPASSSMLKNTYLDEHLTVSSLLNALGLGKYAIIFQAEEVDMAALKQMGDRDLKELGIPMGPRKKILLAMFAQSKRPTT